MFIFALNIQIYQTCNSSRSSQSVSTKNFSKYENKNVNSRDILSSHRHIYRKAENHTDFYMNEVPGKYDRAASLIYFHWMKMSLHLCEYNKWKTINVLRFMNSYSRTLNCNLPWVILSTDYLICTNLKLPPKYNITKSDLIDW